MKHLTDVVIVGAGVIGCSIAYALRKQGIDVVVLDKNEVGAQASQAASGMLAPLKPFADPGDPYTRLLLASLARFPELVPELEDASGICLAYQTTGTLRVMQTKRLSRLRAWVSTWRSEGFPVELLIDDDIQHYEPGLATDISLVLYNPHDPQLDALQLVRAYACAASNSARACEQHCSMQLGILEPRLLKPNRRQEEPGRDWRASSVGRLHSWGDQGVRGALTQDRVH
jgi:glycine oxidase